MASMPRRRLWILTLVHLLERNIFHVLPLFPLMCAWVPSNSNGPPKHVLRVRLTLFFLIWFLQHLVCLDRSLCCGLQRASPYLPGQLGMYSSVSLAWEGRQIYKDFLRAKSRKFVCRLSVESHKHETERKVFRIPQKAPTHAYIPTCTHTGIWLCNLIIHIYIIYLYILLSNSLSLSMR